MDGDVRIRVHRIPGQMHVSRATVCLEARPSEVELGHIDFDLTDDAELIAYAMYLRVLQRGGIPVTSRTGVSLDADELEAILDR